MLPPLPPRLLRDLAYPIYRTLRRDGIVSALSGLERDQWRPLEEIEELRRERMRRFLGDALTGVPYYRDCVARLGMSAGEIARSADPSPLPLLDKAIIRAEGDRMWTDDRSLAWYPSSTGGSTGEPLFFRNDRAASAWRRAATIRALRWAGIEPGDRQALFWGFALGASRAARLRHAMQDYVNNILSLSTFDLSPRRMDEYVRRLKHFRPQYMVAYPSALAIFAEHCRTGDSPVPPVRAVVTSGEQLYPWQRELIEEVFSCRVFDRYGSREFSITAQECPEHDGLHIFTDLLHVELIREDGSPAGPGEEGEIVVTDPLNRVMPFIRYRTGDLAVRADHACPCGRGFPLLERIEGRTLDAVVTPDGRRVGGFFWTWLSRAVPGIARFQVEQRDRAGVIMRIVPGQSWRSNHAAVLEAKIREACGADFGVSVETVEEIPLTRSGKSRFIVSRVT